ncbi:uncharacterized protein [Hoplias malabaricus]|uniref:uncharacterized protein n=1 Tax=Hoplias malabaricus TaxID=27720 RepID=UPI003462C727
MEEHKKMFNNCKVEDSDKEVTTAFTVGKKSLDEDVEEVIIKSEEVEIMYLKEEEELENEEKESRFTRTTGRAHMLATVFSDHNYPGTQFPSSPSVSDKGPAQNTCNFTRGYTDHVKNTYSESLHKTKDTNDSEDDQQKMVEILVIRPMPQQDTGRVVLQASYEKVFKIPKLYCTAQETNSKSSFSSSAPVMLEPVQLDHGIKVEDDAENNLWECAPIEGDIIKEEDEESIGFNERNGSFIQDSSTDDSEDDLSSDTDSVSANYSSSDSGKSSHRLLRRSERLRTMRRTCTNASEKTINSLEISTGLELCSNNEKPVVCGKVSTFPEPNSSTEKQDSSAKIIAGKDRSSINNPQICSSCGLRKVPSLEQHKEQCKCIPIFQCYICGVIRKSDELLLKHQAEKHPLTKYYCSSCHRVFPNQSSFTSHPCLTKMHNGQIPPPAKTAKNAKPPPSLTVEHLPLQDAGMSSKQPLNSCGRQTVSPLNKKEWETAKISIISSEEIYHIIPTIFSNHNYTGSQNPPSPSVFDKGAAQNIHISSRAYTDHVKNTVGESRQIDKSKDSKDSKESEVDIVVLRSVQQQETCGDILQARNEKVFKSQKPQNTVQESSTKTSLYSSAHFMLEPVQLWDCAPIEEDLHSEEDEVCFKIKEENDSEEDLSSDIDSTTVSVDYNRNDSENSSHKILRKSQPLRHMRRTCTNTNEKTVNSLEIRTGLELCSNNEKPIVCGKVSTFPEPNSSTEKQVSSAKVIAGKDHSLINKLQICSSCGLRKVATLEKSIEKCKCMPIFQCNICGVIRSSNELLLKHQDEKHPVIKYDCSSCHRVFPYKNSFMSHPCFTKVPSGQMSPPAEIDNNVKTPLTLSVRDFPSHAFGASSKQPFNNSDPQAVSSSNENRWETKISRITKTATVDHLLSTIFSDHNYSRTYFPQGTCKDILKARYENVFKTKNVEDNFLECAPIEEDEDCSEIKEENDSLLQGSSTDSSEDGLSSDTDSDTDSYSVSTNYISDDSENSTHTLLYKSKRFRTM